MTDTGSVFALVKNAVTLTHKVHFCTSAHKVRYGEEVPAQVRDVQDVLEDGLLMAIASVVLLQLSQWILSFLR